MGAPDLVDATAAEIWLSPIPALIHHRPNFTIAGKRCHLTYSGSAEFTRLCSIGRKLPAIRVAWACMMNFGS